MTPNEIATEIEIAKANLSETDISNLWDLLREKSKALRHQQKLVAKATMSVGLKVQIKDISPKGLNGLKGTISEIRASRADVKLDNPVPAWSTVAKHAIGGIVRGVPLTCLDVTS